LGLVACATACSPPNNVRNVVYDASSANAKFTVYDALYGVHPPESKDAFVRGTVDLTVTLRNANPLCYSYAASVGIKSFTPEAPLGTLNSAGPMAAQGASALTIARPLSCDSALRGQPLVKCVSDAVSVTMLSLSKIQDEASRAEQLLTLAWLACGNAGPDILGGGLGPDPVLQRQSIQEAATLVSMGMKTWYGHIQNANSMPAFLPGATARLNGELALELSTQKTRSDAVAAAIAAGEPGLEIAQLRHELDAATAVAAQTDAVIKGLPSADAIAKLGASAQTAADAARNDVTDAVSLFGPKPWVSTIVSQQHVLDNQVITVEVTRTPLSRGKAIDKAAAQSLGVAHLYTLRPVWLDVGVGPSITLSNNVAYGIGAQQQIVKTQDTVNLDGVVTFSFYWQPRFLDGSLYSWDNDAVGWLPRPMIGLSMTQPISSVYLGGQFDLVKFLDISFGARAFSTTALVGPPEGALASTDSTGKPVAPVTRTTERWAPFFSISASTDLFTQWLKALAK
jgi:hypothetical protein